MTSLTRLATENYTHEKAYKYNVGLDATLFSGLDVTLEGYYQKRKDIWVEASGKYTDVIGIDAPYENAGVVNSWGFEASLDYNKKFGEVSFNIGGEFNLNRNQIKEQLEEPRVYDKPCSDRSFIETRFMVLKLSVSSRIKTILLTVLHRHSQL